MTMTEQEKLDRQNPAWRPEWKRKQKRTAGKDIEPISGTQETFIPSAINQQSALSILTACNQYFDKNPGKMLPSDFFIDCNIPEDILHSFTEEISKSTELTRLKKRAREICENRIVNCALRSHTNPATTIFLLKNKFGYVDKTEGGGAITNIAIDARSFLQQLGRLPEQEAERKADTTNKLPK